MQADERLQALLRRGCEVRADGGRLLVRPAAALDDALRAAIRQRKADLLRLLTTAPPAVADPTHDRTVAERVAVMRQQFAHSAVDGWPGAFSKIALPHDRRNSRCGGVFRPAPSWAGWLRCDRCRMYVRLHDPVVQRFLAEGPGRP